MVPCAPRAGKWYLVSQSSRIDIDSGVSPAEKADSQSFGSANIASAALSPIFAALLRRFGPRTTLIGWTVFSTLTISVGILCIRPRRADNLWPDGGTQTVKPTLRPFKSPYLWLFVASMAVQSLANNLPANYLPSYATDLGIDSSKAALLVTYLSLSGIVGQVAFGALTWVHPFSHGDVLLM